ncbi:MAG: peptidoglycan DD-metalloendopeptidase family protein [Alphaproteobacteria bacterium]|nr:peptidoglycan DD-metalloendopeptidase family protein [Alphaproteobacteria bacterium]
MMGTKAHGSLNTVIARNGDTVYTLARYLGVDMRALIDNNHLSPPYKLTPGQVINVPAPATVKVGQGDTVFSIANAYGADRSELVRLNNLSPPYRLINGQVLKLPSTSAAIAPLNNNAASDDVPIIASVEELPATAPVSPSGLVQEEDLAPPPGAAKAASTAAPIQTASLSPAAPIAAKAKPSLGTGTPSFSWPVNGATLSGFGPKEGGRHNDGINIGAPLGSPVRSAATGDVVYSGNKVAGFGHLILVRHSGGFSTAYAHLQNPLVKQGERVAAGQAIAQIGKSGNVISPQLHFEIRKGTSAVNPKMYLP